MNNNTTRYPSNFKSSDAFRCFEVTKENVPSLHMLLTLLHLQKFPFTAEIERQHACNACCAKAKRGVCVETKIDLRDLEFRTTGIIRGTALSNLSEFADCDHLDAVSFIELLDFCRSADIPSKETLMQIPVDHHRLCEYRKGFLNELDMFLTLTGHNDDDRKFVLRELGSADSGNLLGSCLFYESYLNNECERTAPVFDDRNACNSDLAYNLRRMFSQAA